MRVSIDKPRQDDRLAKLLDGSARMRRENVVRLANGGDLSA
jgi:hypothetical protein